MSRKLDARVAERVMGRKVIETDECNGEDNLWLHSGCDDCGHDDELPFYSTDISAAWLVVAHLEKSRGMRLDLGPNDKSWHACFLKYAPHDEFEAWSVMGGANAKTAPDAICHAALRAVSR